MVRASLNDPLRQRRTYSGQGRDCGGIGRIYINQSAGRCGDVICGDAAFLLGVCNRCQRRPCRHNERECAQGAMGPERLSSIHDFPFLLISSPGARALIGPLSFSTEPQHKVLDHPVSSIRLEKICRGPMLPNTITQCP